MEESENPQKRSNTPLSAETLQLPLPSIEIHPPSDTEDDADESGSGASTPRANSFPIYIDDLGCHDFDFSQRRKPVSRRRKLVKSINRISHRRSSSGMAPETRKQDSNVAANLEDDLSARLGHLLSPSQVQGAESAPKRNPKPTDFIFYDKPMSIDEAAMLAVSPQPFAMEPDRLPLDDKKALEARLNFHLSELDHLKKYINFHNDSMFQTDYRAGMIAGRATGDEVKSITLMRELSNAQRVLRNVAKPFVEYHRNEVDRIAEIRVQMNINNGLGRKVPQIFKNLPNDYEWAEMFMA